MGKEKSWKLDKVLKIDDTQLKTPEHDRMCLWVHKNYMFFVNQIAPKQLLESQHEQQISLCQFYFWDHNIWNDESEKEKKCKKCVIKKFFTKLDKKTLKQCKEYENIKKEYKKFVNRLNHIKIDDLFNIVFKWEYPIKNNNYVVGIPDFSIFVRKKTEYGIRSDNSRFINRGFPSYNFNIIIEVKPQIKSIGETMRQLQLYNSYLPIQQEFKNYIWLVTKNEAHKEIFENQGINYFILTDKMMEKKNGNIL